MIKAKEKTISGWLPFLIDGCHVEVFFSTEDTPENCDEDKVSTIEQALMTTYQKANDNKNIQ